MLGSIITQAPGSSRYFLGGLIAYVNEIKQRFAGVGEDTLTRYGAVSAEVARAMAQAMRRKFKSDIGIGVTGIAGPGGGSEKKPVGLVYIGLSLRSTLFVERFVFKGDREKIRRKACHEALRLLHRALK
jgi:nicotinamide-nucleotide amidase